MAEHRNSQDGGDAGRSSDVLSNRDKAQDNRKTGSDPDGQGAQTQKTEREQQGRGSPDQNTQ